MTLKKLEKDVEIPLTREQMLSLKGGAEAAPSIDLTGTNGYRTDAGASTHDDYDDAD